MKSACPPVLLLVFNRPDLGAQVFERVRQVRPDRLFIAADGPRPDRLGEADLCTESRRIVERVDWPCEVKTLFREQNLGCRKAISAAVTWFLENVESGVILEDDCLPDPTFFRFCEELLVRYSEDERVMAISGNHFQRPSFDPGGSYYFSIYPHCWGWATWRRAWQHYDDNMVDWPSARETGWLNGLMQKPEIADYNKRVFDVAHQGRVDSWAYRWTYACMRNSGLAVLPCINLVTNIGFDDRSTHTAANMEFLQIRSGVMPFPLRHPVTVTRNFDADLYSAYHVFRVPRFPRLCALRQLLVTKIVLCRYLAWRLWNRIMSIFM